MPIDYRTVVAGALAMSTQVGCLPTPDIHVPDFSSPPPVDASTQPADMRVTVDGATSADLAPTLHWMADGQGVATDIVRGVWVADAALSQAYAVGNNGLILHRSGGTWQKEVAQSSGMPITANLYAVAAVSPDLVYAVGDAGVILRRSAGTWTQEGQELMTTMGLFGVTVITTGEVIVVGDAGLIARRQLGTGVYVSEDTTALTGASLRAVSGSTLDSLYAVGPSGVIAQRVSGMASWKLDPLPIDAGDQGNYYAVAQSADGVFVAGEYGKVLRRDVAKWTRETTVVVASPMPHFYGLYAGTAGVFVVGASGNIQFRDSATKTWAVEPTNVTVGLYGVAGVGSGVLTVGEQGTLLRRM